MDGNVPVSAAGWNGSSADGSIAVSRRELSMLLYLAMVNEGETAHEGRGRRERLIAAECYTNQSFPAGSPVRANHSRVRPRAKGQQKGTNDNVRTVETSCFFLSFTRTVCNSRYTMKKNR